METLETKVEEQPKKKMGRLTDRIGHVCRKGLGHYAAFTGGVLMAMDPFGLICELFNDTDSPMNTIGGLGTEMVDLGDELTGYVAAPAMILGAAGEFIGSILTISYTEFPELPVMAYVATAAIDGVYNSLRLAYKTIQETVGAYNTKRSGNLKTT